ncbi:MAG TPA: hypothetical protein VK004_01010 [Ignavibacteria bacterium]|nr:hypothetical protein [Ignavibacteria bacterium]
MKFILTLIAFIFFTPFFVFSQNNRLERNIEIFDRIIDKSFTELENRMIVAGKDKVFQINLSGPSDSDDYILEKLRRRLSGFNVIYETNYDSVFANVFIDSIKLKTRYRDINTSKVLGDKMVDRVVSVAYNVRLVQVINDEVLLSERFNESYEDSFKLDELSRVESDQYSFLKAELPSEGFFSKYLLPTVLIGASAATIILFFLIRSE